MNCLQIAWDYVTPEVHIVAAFVTALAVAKIAIHFIY